ncbi:MAG: polymer-forming cytoskeletal protein [Gammaproteobacteria bacterium]|nr:polymer-forming cytoskeletal protein [Gammaproteobacteria bacterium]MBT8111303.1 polymer-forming cytoskeletal protein [Gammaproteobacteria bacterium]NND46062.1 polymer-forming cytoskeletal protein [Woeseiaceae bacterium]NNL46001.1 polymer-forming cytoskeletal protein [Woeseiaceae bacterium]
MNEAKRRRLRDRSSGAATLINEGCKITGVISGSGDFLINGEIEGDCDIGGTVTLARNGLWRGLLKAGTVIVSGHVEGDVVATGKVEIAASAKIVGTVSGDAIAVAEGAIVEGVMKTTGQADPVEFVEKRKQDN